MAFNQFPSKGGIPSGNTAGRPGSPVIGDTYYNGELEILEIYNGDDWVAASAPPATPTIATPTDVGTVDYTAGGSLSVVFTAGSGGGTPSQYNAFTTAGGFSASSSSTTVTLTGLTPATSFTVYGNAQNNFGTTVNTSNSAAVTATTKPQAPTIGTATLTNGVPVVNWTLGNNGGKNLTSITITPYLNGTTAQTSQTASTTSSTSHTFTGLTEDASYTFKVKVTNANGDSPDSSASNSVTVDAQFSAEYLVVAAGGGGGVDVGGGGGAGGMLSGTQTLNKGTTYTITVGSGGAGTSAAATPAGDGGNSSIAGTGLTTITATGGGGGGNWSGAGTNSGGRNGGSGGGAGGWSLPASYYGGTGIDGQGFKGGDNTVPATNTPGAGGGGAGGAGTNSATSANSTSTSAGGPGAASSITGSSVTYAAGGRGQNDTTTGGQNGGANTGNGGDGGGSGNNPNDQGYNGGSGVVIIRATTSATATTGSPTVTTSGSYTIYKFNGNGSITY
jgi:hypothetical protein